MSETKYKNALGVRVEGDILCLSCAKQVADDSEYKTLFWMANKPKEYKSDTPCFDCGERIDTLKSEKAAVEIQKDLTNNKTN